MALCKLPLIVRSSKVENALGLRRELVAVKYTNVFHLVLLCSFVAIFIDRTTSLALRCRAFPR